MNQWDGIRYFRPDSNVDNWGDPSKIKRQLLVKLDALRDYLGYPLYVSSGYRPSDTSQHGKGIAGDLVCPDLHVMDLYMSAERFGFNGLGVYGHWKFKGKTVGGIHADTRKNHARWLCYLDDGVQRYTALTVQEILRYGIL